jgi:hypothetical protein
VKRKRNVATGAVAALGSGATPEAVRAAVDACVSVMGPPSPDDAFAAIAKLAEPLAAAQRGPAVGALRRLADGGASHLATIARLTPSVDRQAAVEATVATALAPSPDDDVDAQIDSTLVALSAVAALEPTAQAEPVGALIDHLPASLTASETLRVGRALRGLSAAGAGAAFDSRSRFEPDAALVMAACTARAPGEVEIAWAGLVAEYARHLTPAIVFQSLALLVEHTDSARLASFDATFPDLHSFHDQVSGPLAIAWARAGDAARGYRVASTIKGASARLEARIGVAARSTGDALKAQLALDLATDASIGSWLAAQQPQAFVRALGEERSLAFAAREDVSVGARAELLAQLSSASANSRAEALFDEVRGGLLELTLDDLFAMAKLRLPPERCGELLRALLTSMLQHDPKNLFFDDWEGHDLGALVPLLAHIGGPDLITAVIERLAAPSPPAAPRRSSAK